MPSSALLLAGKFIQLNLNSKGVYFVKVLMDKWESFFDHYGLKARGSSERDGVTSKLQVGGVFNDALTADKSTEKRGNHNYRIIKFSSREEHFRSL